MKPLQYIKALITVVILIILDQVTKAMAVSHLMNTQGIDIIPGVFRLQYLQNRGAAFGLMQDQKLLFAVFTIIIVLAMLWIFTRIPDTGRMLPLKVIDLLIISGAIGNFIDRMTQSYVVDFFYFELIDFPIFNVADIYVTISCVLLIILVMFYYKEKDFDFIFKRKANQEKESDINQEDSNDQGKVSK